MSNTHFLKVALRYLLLTFEQQIYYHLGDHFQYDFLPRFFRRLGLCLLETNADHQILLQYYPAVIQSYLRCIKTLSLHEHIFSADSNQIKVDWYPNTIRCRQLSISTSFVVSLLWESSYDRSLSYANQFYR